MVVGVLMARGTRHRAITTILAVLLLCAPILVSGCSSGDASLDPAVGASSTGGESAGSRTDAGDGDLLQAEMQAWHDTSDLVGVTAAVATAEDTWAGAVGVDGAGQPLVPDTAMGIGSVTKTVTAAEVMLLAERGLVDLDAPVTDYVTVPFDAQGATVRQLLGMRSGFPDPTDAVFAAASRDPQRAWTTQDWYAVTDVDEPGSGREVDRYRYNNLNYIVLTELIEAVTDAPYAVAVRQDLLDPAGVPRVWVQDEEKPEPPVAVGVDDPDLPLVDPGGPWLPSRTLASSGAGAGSLAADAASVAAWGLAVYGGQILHPRSVQAMTTTSDIYGYGLGTMVGEDSDGRPVVGHDGDMVVYTSVLMVWPADGIAVAVLSPQGADKPLGSLAEQLFHAWSER